MGIERLGKALADVVKKLSRAAIIDRRVVEEVVRDIQRALLMADVNVRLVLELSNRIRERALKVEVPPGFTKKDVVIRIIYEELVRLLGGEKPPRIDIPRRRGYTIMLVGIQGSGKTTSAAKLAWFFKNRGYKVALICADTYRPGAHDQLKQLAELIEAPMYGPKDSNSRSPVDIALEGVSLFKKQGYDVIIIDTAGRHKDEHSLMKEMTDIASKIRPDEVMLVIDATIGQQAYSQAKAFNEAVKLGSIFISKLDGSAKGGGALSAVAATGAVIKFIGTGEKVDEIELFDPSSFVSRLLGMGDVRLLVEKLRKAEELMSPKKQEELLRRMMTGRFTLMDLYDQIRTVRRLGPLAKLLELIPGMAYTLPREAMEVAEEKFDKWMVIMQSMTKEELENPKIINRSRMERIAKGSGTTVKDVKELLDYYFKLTRVYRKLLRQSRRMRGLDLMRGTRKFPL
ncbi:MAG: signal recognition particle protein [Thermoprotei archaeon]|nr:MAG: signal recognition particle protein [Thermoprotei archaeon]